MSEPRHISVCIDEWLDEYAALTTHPDDATTTTGSEDGA